MLTREEIARQALALPPEDRIYVAEVLDQSFANEGFATPEIADAWSAEIERRIADFEQGGVQAATGAEALNRMRTRLAEMRTSRTTT